MQPRIKPSSGIAYGILAFVLLTLTATAWGQDEEAEDKKEEQEKEVRSEIASEVSLGVYYLSEDSFRYGKYSGLTDEGFAPLVDFIWQKRPEWDSGDTVRWRLQGWRLGLDSRRLAFDYNDQGTQKFRFDFRSIPNNRFSDGMTPYRPQQPGLWNLAPEWEVAPGSSNTLGFTNLQETLVRLNVDTKRQWFDLGYDRRLGSNWKLDVDWKHETKEGNRSLGAIFGHAASNPRSVILPAPVDWTTDIVEAMFRYTAGRAQFGAGVYASFFSNDESILTFQNAYGYRNGWAPGVEYPDAYGRLALAPDNSYVQIKAYGGMNFGRSTRLTADVSYGKMRQDEGLLPYTINPDLEVHTPVPLQSLDAEVNTAMVNLRLTSQLARRLGLAVNYHYDDRDNKTPRAVYPYIGGDSQDQRRFEQGRINRPYSYTKHRADAVMTWRFARASRLRAGVDYSDYSRDYQEVRDSDELGWLVGVSLRGWSQGSLNFDYRSSERDVSEYVGNVPLVSSYLPGTVDEDEYENHPLLRKYFLTDRDRDEFRLRADYAPAATVNVGLAASYAEDDYDDNYFGLNSAKVRSVSFDAGWYPQEHISLTAFYTKEKYDADQSARGFFNDASAEDPANDWFVDTSDKVDTWHLAVTFTDLGEERGWKGLDFGLDYTFSDTRNNIDVTAVSATTGPLPTLQSKLRTFTLWGSARLSPNSSLRLAAESSDLTTSDWALDGVEPDTLANVLLLGESAANYDLWLISASWRYQF
jgi:MtrB/PioB family decaheme-associated outer membrane protein